MSVPENKRSQSRFEVQTRAEELADYTLTICNNEKVFPKRGRWLLTNRIVSVTLDIVENIDFANGIYVSTSGDFELRRNAQTTVLGDIDKLLGLVNLAYKHYSLQGDRVAYWTDLIVRLQALVRGWRNADIKQFSEFIK